MGRRSVRLIWHGDPKQPVRISCMDIQALGADPSLRVQRCFPWPLRRTGDYDLSTMQCEFVRTDQGVSWLYWCVRRGVECVLRFLCVRLILTAHVWGLADVPAYCIPSLSHLRLFSWFRRITKRV